MTGRDGGPRNPSRPAPAVAIVLLLLMGLLAGGAALRESVTLDEVAHIGAGVSYLQKFELRLNGEHPPLAKMLAALPLVVGGVRADYSSASWTISTKFFPDAFLGQWAFGQWVLSRWNDPVRTLALARLPMLLLTLVLGWLIFRFARELGGDWGGLLCLTAYVTCPLFLTFGPLVLTDVTITLFSVLSLWSFATLWQRPTRKHQRMFALWLACALLSKYSAGILFFAFAAFALSTRWRPVAGQPAAKPEARAWRRARWRATLTGTLLAALIVYAVYFVFSWSQTHEVLYLMGKSPYLSPVKRLLMPPWLYVRGMGVIALTYVRQAYLLGRWYPHGVWFFFPVLFLLKSTLGFLALVAAAMIAGIVWRSAPDGRPNVAGNRALHWRVLWTSLVVYLAICIAAHFNVSIRHFSTPQVLLTLMLAPLPNLLAARLKSNRSWAPKLATAVVVLAALSSMVSVVRTYPYYMPYFNGVARTKPLYVLAGDSNVDWNQALPQVKEFADKHAVRTARIDTYGFNDPAASVPGAEIWDCQLPAAQDAGAWVFVSSDMIRDNHNCEWLLAYPHEALAGGSMYALRLPSPIPEAGTPGGPPLPGSHRHFLGWPVDGRAMFLSVILDPKRIPEIVADMQKEFASGDTAPGNAAQETRRK